MRFNIKFVPLKSFNVHKPSATSGYHQKSNFVAAIAEIAKKSERDMYDMIWVAGQFPVILQI